ncbi:hypothetical protein ANCDUO_22302 [Ancylostoma duodenale]|uniref:Uncharacterized protein n=1 Tax=Ancylostoma duodenale TaxID=51022 RepID=A0A0C2BUK7_9BILA|nr:hypothetical protein ANCDUO_22302 [Ancylostoma duodenale]
MIGTDFFSKNTQRFSFRPKMVLDLRICSST